jgi:hypothetical protein
LLKPAVSRVVGVVLKIRDLIMSLGTILLIILVIVLLGGFSGFGGGPFYGTWYYGGGDSVSCLLSCWFWCCSADFKRQMAGVDW